jgi:hypothetical protein
MDPKPNRKRKVLEKRSELVDEIQNLDELT